MREFYWVWTGELDDKAVEKIKKTCGKVKTNSAVVKGDGYDESIRISEVSWIKDKEITELIWKYIMMANTEAFGFNIVRNDIDIQYTKYSGDKKSFYGWHRDNEYINNKMVDRKLSIIIQLTDPEEYEGGEFEMKIDKDTISISGFEKKGSILVFPSFMEHQVKPTTKGVRNSLVSWIEGPHFL